MTVGSEVERAAVVETDRVLLEGPHSRTRELWLVYTREARRSGAVQSVARFVTAVMRDNARRVSGAG